MEPVCTRGEQSASRERDFLQLPDWVIIGASRASGLSKPKAWLGVPRSAALPTLPLMGSGWIHVTCLGSAL